MNPKTPKFATHYLVKKTNQVGEWISATGGTGKYELRFADGLIRTFEYNELEPSTPEDFLDTQIRTKPN
jgi:hypothetical protein